MREIQFRALATDLGDDGESYWIFSAEEGLRDFFDETVCEWRKSTLGQFTGLSDKNGKKIYEGDILKEEGSHGYTYNKVEFGTDPDHWGFSVDYIQSFDTDGTPVDGRFSRYLSLNWIHERSVVICNIYENPELLKRLTKHQPSR